MATKPESGAGGGRKQAARERIAARRAAERAAEDAARRRRRLRTLAGIGLAVLVVAAVVVVVVIQSGRTDTADATPPGNTAAGTSGTAFAVGSADAPVTVDVYEDYQCPVCQAFEDDAGDTIDQLLSAGTIRLVVHPVAILDRVSDDEYSTRAANAAAVVADAAGADAVRTFGGLLFDRQPAENGPGLTDDELVELAAQAGATGEDVEAGIRDRRYGDWVAAATDRASQDGLTGTPWVLVDGTPLTSPSGESLAAAVQAAAG